MLTYSKLTKVLRFRREDSRYNGKYGNSLLTYFSDAHAHSPLEKIKMFTYTDTYLRGLSIGHFNGNFSRNRDTQYLSVDKEVHFQGFNRLGGPVLVPYSYLRRSVKT